MIQFRLLGPLEVIRDDERAALGGVKQRALLGRLLLEPNQVVAASRLVESLWSDDAPPVTARKILQNSVWSLRSVLGALRAGAAVPALITQSPGYLLSVDEDLVDVHAFYRQLELGRKKMANGLPAEAAGILRDALDLWRGDVLADLAEVGLVWPESTIVENARTDARELYFEAEIESGRHREVIGGIEKMVETEPLRERARGLLMLALYRSGRQTEALNVYSRTHAELVDRFGLEPGPWLRYLQQRILSQDPALDERGPAAAPDEVPAGRPADLASWLAPDSAPDSAADDEFLRDLLGTPGVAVPAPPPSHRREATVMIVRAHVGAGASSTHPVGVDELLDGIHTLVRTGVECCGGEILASVGSATIALFDFADPRESAAKATQLALLLRDSLDVSDEHKHGLTIRAMVATGDLQWHADASPRKSRVSANGTLLDQCWEIFPQVPVGMIWVSDRTRSLTADQVSYLATAGGEVPYWVAEAPSVDYPVDTKPFMDREHEMEILQRMFERVERRSIPHLVTILGGHGTGKSRLLMEFCRLLEDTGRPVPLIVRYRVSRSVSIDPSAVLRQLRSPDHDPARPVHDAEDVVREFAQRRPVVIAVDDLHLADEATRGFFERLGSCSRSGMLLVVACANENFHRRFPQWGLAQPNSTRILLEPLSVDAVARLFENLLGTIGECITESTWRIFHRIFGGPGSGSAKRARLLRALPLVVGTNSFPGDHQAGDSVAVKQFSSR
ncbi:BTAD domain-containing putative transcriptional regulator [Actinosynnema sp. NPDC047251]|uniref:Putative transcriptional regulator n=1 Tax=Saccharothrix espanaensis (strain ATCC 51144 / DSM 44229 / JCM 9112 / NBRC 15066 / NRRL 15764) TaxID=1179773 RepID=K0K344_SACES|nr:AfsR/SARP family transcriptional regulator [Saccharothrix espanaensis]CCH32007.1 putative transcriptional regulator [Saccharothrix espanaensis DSM 44229]